MMGRDVDETGWEFGAQQHDLSLKLWRQGHSDEAERLATAALSSLEAALPDGHYDTANAADTLANMFAERGRHAQAIPHWRRALTILDHFRDDDLASQLRLRVLQRMCYALTLRGDFAESGAALEQLLRESAEQSGVDSLSVALAQNLIGMDHKLQGRLDLAESAYEKSRALYEQHSRPLPAELLHNLAGLACARGAHTQAETLARAAISRRRDNGDKSSLALSCDLAGLGDALAGLGRLEEAVATYREALSIHTRAGREEHPEFAYTLHNLADALVAQGQLDAAVRGYHDAIRHKESALGPQHPEIAASLNNLAGALSDLSRHDEALACSDRAMQLAAQLQSDHPIRIGSAALNQSLRQLRSAPSAKAR